eukprot:gene4688-5737_t
MDTRVYTLGELVVATLELLGIAEVQGAICYGHHHPPYTDAGYWIESEDMLAADSPTFKKCPAFKSSCNSVAECYVGADGEPLPSPGADCEVCQEGYKGRLCSSCEEGYYHYDGTKCLRCEELPLYPMPIFLYPLLFTFTFFSFMRAISASLASFAVCVNNLKILAILLSLKLEWDPADRPDATEGFRDKLRVLNYNIDLSVFECSLGWGFKEKWWFTIFLPFILVAMESVPFLTAMLANSMKSHRPDLLTYRSGWPWLLPIEAVRKVTHGYRVFVAYLVGVKPPAWAALKDVAGTPAFTTLVDPAISFVVRLSSQFFIVETTKTLQVFARKSLNGKGYVGAAPDIDWGSQDHMYMVYGAVVFFTFYCILIPGLKIKVIRDGVAQRTLGDKQFRDRWKSLYLKQFPEFWWWFIFNSFGSQWVFVLIK